MYHTWHVVLPACGLGSNKASSPGTAEDSSTAAAAMPVCGCCHVQLTRSALQVLLEMQQLMQRLDRSSQGRTQRLLLLLKAQGYKELFGVAEQELRDCLEQLSAILNIAQFTSQVCFTADWLTDRLTD
jgi:hypothetical protein